MRIIQYIVIVSALVACSETTESSSDKNTDNNAKQDSAMVEVNDSTTIGDNSDEDDKEAGVTTYNTLEDYAKLNTRSAIIERFPTTYREDTTWVAEGTRMMLSIQISNPEKGHKITYLFDPEDNANMVSSVEARHTSYDRETFEETGKNQLKSETGIYLGMPLKELHELNGAPITFAGFGWDFGGNARANEGKLKDSELTFMLDTRDYSDNSMIGDIMFSTEDETIRNKPVFVESMSIYL